jgi:pimeloyl-ACP methyl ester carboxylesterase/DNA-binding SARP family transcriptional activator
VESPRGGVSLLFVSAVSAAPPVGLSVRLLGALEVARGGQALPLPPSKKTRALLAYLVATGRPHARDRLCSLLWDVTDDPRGALRWSVSKLRGVLDDGAAAPRILADREQVAFQAAGAQVDVAEVAAVLAGGLDQVQVDRLRQLIGAFRGPFLEGIDLDDFDDFQAWCVAERERWRAVHGRLLRALVDRLEPQPAEALEFARELVRVAPQDEAARATLVRLLLGSGHREEAEAHYRIGQKQAGERTTGELHAAWRQATATPATPAPSTDPPQVIRFCTAPDGVRLAYATVGQGPPLVKAPNWLTHLEYDWKSPIWRHLARALAQERTLVRFDQRGNGLSDWQVDDISFEAFVRDLETVVDAAGLQRFPLFGLSQGCAISIAYAVRHPERVSHLILLGGYPVGWHQGPRREPYSGMLALMRAGWGAPHSTFRQMFSTLFMPEATPTETSWFNELQLVSASGVNAARIFEALGPVDLRPLLPKIAAPTLVLHAAHDAVVPFEEGRRMAAGIPNARFVALEGRNHLLLEDEPAWPRFLAEVRAFLATS